MDEIKELTDRLTERKQEESSVTIKWAVIFGALWSSLGGLPRHSGRLLYFLW